MAQVNPLTREVLIKLVYYGPGLGGKTTTLQRVHAVSPAETRGKIVSLATPVDRTLYFDFLPLRVGPVKGYPVRLQLFTVPGQVYFNATRKLVLTGADGVVFVADSQRERQDANVESLQNLEANLAEQNRRLDQIPHVFQLNKRDLPNVVSTEALAQSLNQFGAPVFASSAAKGEGVLEPLDELVRLVLDDLERREVFGESPKLASTRRQPSFGPASDGLGESLTRASEELWQSGGSSGPPRAASSRPATAGSASYAAPSSVPAAAERAIAPAAEASATQADLPPVDLAPPFGIDGYAIPSSLPAPQAATTEAAQGTPASSAAPAEERASPDAHSSAPESDGSQPARTPTFGPNATASTAVGGRLSWAAAFDADQQGSVQEVEAELAQGDCRAAVLRCDSLAAELLATAALHAGLVSADQHPTTVALALGVPGPRWLRLCRLISQAKEGEALTPVDALDAYAVVIEINRLRRSL